ncbi:MAG: multicopper oxidase family protein [Acidimicrobiales bacterium]|nr:multicopper oxidase family protein [Acidimicrobiales bacterium]
MPTLREALTRRRFIGALGAGGATALLTACSSSGTGESPGAAAPSGPSFVQPESITSEDGLLEMTLRAEPTHLPWGNSTRYAYTYNGTSPGPTLRLRPGDRLVIHLENGLDDDTNLHTHGLHVSPSDDADNIFLRVAPGESRTYVYDIPSDHRSGLFWYHPHAHGTVAKQVAAGLAGAIVIVDDLDNIPEIASTVDRIWILSDPPVGGGPSVLDAGPMDRMAGRVGDTILINGVERPNVDAEAGTLERWRMVNASSTRYYRLALDGHPIHVIASDGGRLNAPVTVEEVLLAPGERTEFFVTPSTAGSFAFRTLRYDRGSTGMGGNMMGGNTLVDDDAVLATFTVLGNRQPADLPTTLLDANHLTLPAPESSRVLELGMAMGGGMMGGGMGEMMSFTFDGKTFDPDRTDIAVGAGSVEAWEIRNTSPMDHPFHLHVWPFLVAAGPTTAGWKDTINVPAGESVNILVPFGGLTGRTVYHCHILDHEDLGMMGVIEVT